MKKSLYLGALALLTLASCASEETVEAPKGNAIDFGKAFINNSTRGGEELTLDNLTDFNVYGYMSDFSGVLFNGQTVSKGDAGWTYLNTQYWTPNMAYAFAAITPAAGAEFTVPASGAVPTTGEFGTINYTNTGTKDLLYATQFQAAVTPEVNTWPTVNFTFSHLLSRVMITLNNKMTSPDGSFTVSNVKISGGYKTGSINFANVAEGADKAAWTVAENAETDVYNYAMPTTDVTNKEGSNSISSDVFFFIPVSGTYTVEFDVIEKIGGVALPVAHKKAVLTIDLQRGYSYNLVADLNEQNIPETSPKPIEFNVVDVNNWNKGTVTF